MIVSLPTLQLAHGRHAYGRQVWYGVVHVVTGKGTHLRRCSVDTGGHQTSHTASPSSAASTWTHLAPQQGGRGCAPPQRPTPCTELQHVVINYRHQHTGPNLLFMHCAVELFTNPSRSLALWHQQAPSLDHQAVIDPFFKGQPPPPCPRDTDLVQLDKVPSHPSGALPTVTTELPSPTSHK